MKVLKVYLTLIPTLLYLNSWSQSDLNVMSNGQLIVDKDNHSYTTVAIGNNVWSTENLKTSTFKNGDRIFHAKNTKEWMKAFDEKKPAWCYYNWDKSTESTYGKIYNRFAVMDPRGLAPEGTEVPSLNDWLDLCVYWKESGHDDFDAFKSNDELWRENSTGIKNGFNAHPRSGLAVYYEDEDIDQRNPIVYFSTDNAAFWTSSEASKSYSYSFNIYDKKGYFDVVHNRSSGMSVRLISTLGTNKINRVHFKKGKGVMDIDNNYYETIIIYGNEWMTSNLNVSKFNDGTPIPLANDNSEMKVVVEKRSHHIPLISAFYHFDGNYAPYGRFYSSTVLSNDKNVCPVGWHVATHDEWTGLERDLMEFYSSSALRFPAIFKSTYIDSSISLKNYSTGYNTVGLSLFPAGTYGNYNLGIPNTNNGGFNNFGASGIWWRANLVSDNNLIRATRILDYQDNIHRSEYIGLNNVENASFAQIRCVKNTKESPSNGVNQTIPSIPQESSGQRMEETKQTKELIDMMNKARKILKK
jgi:uncharacterized protein (TIGR02145 family)